MENNTTPTLELIVTIIMALGLVLVAGIFLGLGVDLFSMGWDAGRSIFD